MAYTILGLKIYGFREINNIHYNELIVNRISKHFVFLMHANCDGV